MIVEAKVNAIDLILASESIFVPWIVETKLKEQGIAIKDPETPLDFPSTLQERIERPFCYWMDLNGDLILKQRLSKTIGESNG